MQDHTYIVSNFGAHTWQRILISWNLLGIYSLYRRRQRGDMIETYKLLRGFYDIDWSNLFTFNPASHTRGHHLKLYKRQCTLQLRANFFLHRVINQWNSLPDEVVSAPPYLFLKRD